MVYDDSAKIVSYIVGFKMFIDRGTGKYCVGFPEASINMVARELIRYKINYQLVNVETRVHDFGKNNNYNKYLHKDLKCNSDINIREKPSGSFIVKYENEPEEKYIIDDNIDSKAELALKVIKSDVDDIIDINGYKIKVIEKNIIFK